MQTAEDRKGSFSTVPFLLLLCLNAAALLGRYGSIPPAPIITDEVIINDPALALSQGHGLAAFSYVGSAYGIDRVFGHFPPLYELLQGLAFRLFGVSVYSLRLTATLASLATSAVFLYLCRSLYRKGVLSLPAALLTGLLYATWAPLITQQRVARMEPVITVLTMAAFGCVLDVFLRPERPATLKMLAFGVFAGLGLAVHPEAMTGLLFLGPLWVLCPVRPLAKLGAAVMAVLSPVLVWLATFRAQSMFALRQMHAILTSITPIEPRLDQIPRLVLQNLHNPPNLLQRACALGVAGLCVLLIAGWIYTRADAALPSRRTLAIALGLGGALILVCMEFVLRVNVRRYEQLTGPALLGASVVLLGNRRLSGWLYGAAGALVASQLAIFTLYFFPVGERAQRMDPYRYRTIVNDLPEPNRVLVEDPYWLDFQSAGHPIQVLQRGLDGRQTWIKEAGPGQNPLDRFDAIVVTGSDLDEMDAYFDPRWKAHSILAGPDTVVVYLPHGELPTMRGELAPPPAASH